MLLGKWEAIFGQENLDVIPFYNPLLHSTDVVADFCFRNFNLKSISDFQRINHANPRLSGAALFTLATLNALPSAVPSRNLKFVAQLDTGPPGGLVKPEWLKEFLDSFEQSNRAVAARHLRQATLFHRDDLEYEHHDPHDYELAVRTLADFFPKAAELLTL